MENKLSPTRSNAEQQDAANGGGSKEPGLHGELGAWVGERSACPPLCKVLVALGQQATTSFQELPSARDFQPSCCQH